MSVLLKILSALGLGLTVVPAFLVFGGSLAWETHAALMLGGTLLWFATAPFWMHGEPPKKRFWKSHRPV